MSRLKELRKYVYKELFKMDDQDELAAAITHLNGVALAATILAKKRGFDPEVAAMAGVLHDLHAYKTGSYDEHEHKGSELARQILKKLELTNPEETDLICSAIYHHGDKLVVDSPFDELLKDADVISHTLNDPTKAIKDKEKVRFESLYEEFNI